MSPSDGGGAEPEVRQQCIFCLRVQMPSREWHKLSEGRLASMQKRVLVVMACCPGCEGTVVRPAPIQQRGRVHRQVHPVPPVHGT